MTDEIKQAFGCSAPCNCTECNLEECYGHIVIQFAGDIINRKNAEIERLKPFEKKVLKPIVVNLGENLRLEKENKDLKAEIEKQKMVIEQIEYELHPLPFETNFDRAIKQAKTEAIKEFWCRLKNEADFISGGDYGFSFEIREDIAEDIIEEMAGR